MATIKDIAKETGYSISTVSKALKNSTRISKAARKKIFETAKKLNYIPNSSAISLSTGKTGNIGILIPYMKHNSYYDTLIISIISECFRLNKQPVFLVTNYDPQTEKQHLKKFMSHAYDGLIVTSSALSYQEYKKYLNKKHRIITLEINTDEIPYISMDRKLGIELALNYIQKNGCHHPGATFSRTPFSGEGATIAFNTIKAQFPNFDIKDTCSNCRNYEGGIKAGKFFISQVNKVDCILANSDDVAAGIIKAYQKNNLDLPLIIGENNSNLSKFLNIPSLDYHISSIGTEAVKWVTGTKSKIEKVEPTLELHQK